MPSLPTLVKNGPSFSLKLCKEENFQISINSLQEERNERVPQLHKKLLIILPLPFGHEIKIFSSKAKYKSLVLAVNLCHL